MRNRALYVIALLLVAAVGVPAQQPAPAGRADQQPPVTFRVEVNYVEIDAVVTDSQGNFVRGLTKDDFQVLEDGKPQAVTVFSMIDIPVERADPPLFARTAIEPDVISNHQEFNGRVFLLVVDDLHTGFGRSPRAKAAVRLFIERYMGANDMAALVTTSGRTDAAQEFTSRKSLLLSALDRFMGQRAGSATAARIDDYFRNRGMPEGTGTKMSADINDLERGVKARIALDTIRNLSEYMAGVRGRRKALVLFSEGVDYDIGDPWNNRYASDVLRDTREVINAASRANVSIYAVDPRGLHGMGDELIELGSFPDDNSIGITDLHAEMRRGQDSLRTMSEETGGFAVINANDMRTGFERILQDNSAYYVLGYYADARRDGRFRRIDVRVNRPGVSVRARKGYVAARPRTERRVPAAAKMSAELREALDSPLPVSGLHLRAFAAPFKGTRPNASIALVLEVDPGRLAFTENGGTHNNDIEVSVTAVDATGRIRDGGRDLATLKLQPATLEVVRAEGMRLMRRLEVPPGRYQLRIGAREAGGGNVGTVLYDLEVPDFSRGNLHMSGVLISSAAAARQPTANPDPAFKEVLPAPPTARRDFPRGDTLAVFTEVYDNLTSTPHRVEIRTSVLSDSGAVVFTRIDERRSEELQGSTGGFGHTATIPLGDFAPGRYVLRVEAEAQVGRREAAVREVEFRVR